MKLLLEEQERQLEEQQQKLDEQARALELLKKKVEELDEKSRMAEELETLDEMGDEDDLSAMDMDEELRPKFGLNLGAFGDIGFSTDSREKANETFILGSFDLYSTASYGDRLNFLFEMLVMVENHHTDAHIERLWASYTINDALVIRAGRIHTSLGYWHKTYHHGRHLFDTIDRPFFLAFEHDDGVMPLHYVGLELSGSFDLASTRLKYWLGVGNGPRVDDGELHPNDTADDSDSKQVAGRVTFSPRGLSGLSLGVSAAYFDVDTHMNGRIDQNILGLDMQYSSRGGLKLIAEYFHFSNTDASADAFYVQLSKTFFELGLTPFTRYERLDVDKFDPYMSSLAGGREDRAQFIAGMRYDMDALHSSLKAQYRFDEAEDSDNFNIFEAQWSFHF